MIPPVKVIRSTTKYYIKLHNCQSWSRIVDRAYNLVVLFAGAMKDTTVSFKIDRALKAKLVAIANEENRRARIVPCDPRSPRDPRPNTIPAGWSEASWPSARALTSLAVGLRCWADVDAGADNRAEARRR